MEKYMVPPLVLLVDDDAIIRINMAYALEEAGFVVIEAWDVESAFAALRDRADIQLVCTDVHMPGELNGADLAFNVREHHPNMAVIVMSACSRHPVLPPQTPFLCKPFPWSHLIELARRELIACACDPADA